MLAHINAYVFVAVLCLQGHGNNESYYHKAEFEWYCSHTPVPQLQRVKEKVDYIILKANAILPRFIKTQAVKQLLCLHSSL